MTDAHCHVTGGEPAVREFLIGRDFVGVHPWECLGGLGGLESWLRDKLTNPNIPNSEVPNLPNLLPGVGEIGLDRLKDKNISPRMREVFESQLRVALEFGRPVVLHGAKCWGQVVKTIQTFQTSQTSQTSQTFLFHGFSRSDGLIPDIVALNGYISVGPAVLNDHAVNYRELVKKIPLDRLLIETDRTLENAADCPSVREVAAEVAKLRGLSLSELEALTDRNAGRFFPNPQSPIPNPQSPIPNPQSLIPNPQSPIPNPQSLIPNPQSPIPNPQSPIPVPSICYNTPK